MFAPLSDGVLSYGRYSGEVSIRGTFGDQGLTFGILIGCGEATVCSKSVEPGTFGVFPVGFDHSAVYHGGTNYLLFDIAPETLEAFAEEEGYVLGPRVLTTANLYQPSQPWGRYLRQQAGEIVNQLRLAQEPEDQPFVAHALRNQFLRLAVTSLASVSAAERRDEDLQRNSSKILRDVHEWLRARHGLDCDVQELSSYLHMSRSTLFRTFEQEAGISPGKYMKHFRMAQVRRALAHAPNGNQSVTAVASDWGFWQLGQFSADYRRLFGELPSQTLNRAHSIAQDH
jgi:AraC family ethanolamine operon transcriptional activator